MDRGVTHDQETQSNLRTCYLRGWVELVNPAPREEGEELSFGPPQIATMARDYRLTDSGWAALNRSQQLVLLGLFLAAVALFD